MRIGEWVLTVCPGFFSERSNISGIEVHQHGSARLRQSQLLLTLDDKGSPAYFSYKPRLYRFEKKKPGASLP